MKPRPKIPCPACGDLGRRIVDVRGTNKGVIRRRVVCGRGHRYTTHEASIGIG